MELWMEYLLRRKLILPPKMEVISSGPHIHVNTRPSDWELWYWFLMTYRPIIQNHMIGRSDWLPTRSRPLTDQMTSLFRQVPYLEDVWGRWSRYKLLSSTEQSEITI